MSDYYYFNDKDEEWGFTPVLGEDYIRALITIAKKKGIRITNRMVLEELYGSQTKDKRPINKQVSKSKREKANSLTKP